MYIEATDQQETDRADLVSTLLAPGQTYCMEIVLNMHGDGNDIGHINVYVKVCNINDLKMHNNMAIPFFT